MARPRKPSQILELAGAFQKNPQRRRDHEPKPSGPLGAVPESFRPVEELAPADAEEREDLMALWHELVAMVPANVLTISDRWLVELACRAMDRVRKGTALLGDRNFLVVCLSRMGLTPADRSKISVPQESPELDDLAQLALECGPKPN